MDSTVDVLSEQPWGQTYTETHQGRSYHWNGAIDQMFTAQFKLIKDSKQGYWLRGDIVRFGSGYYDFQFRQKYPWKHWFLEKEDYLNALHKSCHALLHGKIPLYARMEFGLMVSRYKWIKFKNDFQIYQDYGSIILMLTGSKAGHMRRFYLKSPFEIIARYPYDHIIPYYRDRGITELPEVGRVQEAMYYSKSKEQFILNMIASFQDENYPKNMEEKHDAATNFRIVRKGEGL